MSLDEIREYIVKKLREGVRPLYGPYGLAGDVARKFGLKISTAGYRVWEIVKAEGSLLRGRQAISAGENLEEGLTELMEERDKELVTGGFTLEEELERQVASKIEVLGEGMRLVARQYKTSAGIVDVLAEDTNGDLVVVELKSGYADMNVLTQLLKYMSAIAKETRQEKAVRGIIIAHDFDDILIDTIRSFLRDKIRLMTYEMKIEFRGLA